MYNPDDGVRSCVQEKMTKEKTQNAANKMRCRMDKNAPTLETVKPIVGKGEIDTIEKLYALNQDEIVQGYREGWRNRDIPIGKSASYMHGWLNAQVDCRYMESSEAQRKLAHDIVSRAL